MLQLDTWIYTKFCQFSISVNYYKNLLSLELSVYDHMKMPDSIHLSHPDPSNFFLSFTMFESFFIYVTSILTPFFLRAFKVYLQKMYF